MPTSRTSLCKSETKPTGLRGTFVGVVAARELLRVAPEIAEEPWSLEALAGRFVEISGGSATAALTAAAGLIVQAQERGELAAWIGRAESIFFPPDFAASGIDLAALPVVRAENVTQMARAADTLLRSGGFALVVLDLDGRIELPMAMQTRLAGLAKQHHAALVCITRTIRRAAARGSLVSLRVETERTRTAPGCFTVTLRAVKDKRRAPGWTHREMCHGPDGVC
jgi:recombination protein RecA